MDKFRLFLLTILIHYSKIRVHEVRTDHTRAMLDPQNYLTKYQSFRYESLFSLFNPIEKIEKYRKYETIEKTEDATENYK